MTDYERGIFSGRCPYTDKPCVDKIPCNKCRMNEEEKRLMEILEEQEKSEVWEEEMR